MSDDEKIIITISVKKIVAVLAGAIFFVVCGLWLVVWTPQLEGGILGNRFFLRAVGTVSILFFGSTFVFSACKLFGKNRAGIIIDEFGITDRSSGSALGFVEWADITEIREVNFVSGKFIVCFLSDPEKYIARKNFLMRYAMRFNHKLVGSPFAVSSTLLTASLDDVHRSMRHAFFKYKTSV